MGYPRIEYNDIKVDFDVHFNDYDPERIDNRDENESASGIIETLHYYGRGIVEAAKERLCGGLIRELREWYRYIRLGNSFKLWWDRDLGMYLSFEGKSLRTNDENDGVFTRTGVAYYEDDDTGHVEEVAADTPRFPAGKFGRGLLIEGNSENIILYSEDFSNAAWVKTDISVSANSSDTLDPEGGTIADKLSVLSTGGSVYQDTSTALSTNNGVFSIWLKVIEPATNLVTLHIEDDTGASKATKNISPTPDWERYNISFSSSGADSDNWRVKITVAAHADETILYAWGAQLEVGTSVVYPTGYMPTVATAATRNDELLYYSLTNDLNIGYLKGSFSLWFKIPGIDEDGVKRTFFSIVDSSNNISIICNKIQVGANNRIGFEFYTPSAYTAVTGSITGTMTADTWHHFVMTYDLTISNGIKLYLDATLLLTSTNTAMMPRIPDKLYIGYDYDASGNPIDSVLDDFEVRKDVLTQEEITAIFGLGKALGYTRNYWPALLLIEPNFSPVLNRGGDVYDFELKAKEELT